MDPEVFSNPPKEHRTAPFWAWNDDLQNDELAWQIRDMKEKGFGGYFMHSREGLATEYLSDAWMDRVATCIRVGKEVDMESWLYDEDRWPSGFAGGFVPAQNPEYRACGLRAATIRAEEFADATADPTTIGVYAVSRDGDGAIADLRVVYPGPGDPEGATEILRLFWERQADTNRFNGEAYVDLLNPEVTEAFLRCTLDAYHERFARDYGEHAPGIFTDEPNYGVMGVPWTRGLPKVFLDRNGYALIEKLPLVLFDGPGSQKLRYDFWRTVTLLFRDAFTRPFAERCAQHGLAMTGHFLCEDTFVSQTNVIGAAMPHYEFMQLPGIDHLGRNINNPMTLKQVSSAAHQFGRNRVLCEIFGTSGHSMSFEDQKWIADWHFALGITFIDQHLTLYSMKGDRKRDYPPTFSYHQPYWKHYRYMNDYFARGAYAMTRGQHRCDILLLHSIASAWCVYRGRRRDGTTDNSEANRYNAAFATVLDLLSSQQRDFDLGDETIMEGHACVVDGQMQVGQARYKLVVVPPSLNWSASTISLLKEFVGAGGRVLVVGEMPSLIDGEPGHRLRELFISGNVFTAENNDASLRAALDSLLAPMVTITTPEGAAPDVFVHCRADGDEAVWFFANKSRDQAYDATITLDTVGGVQQWRLEDGTVADVPAEVRDGRLVVKHRFPPVGSLLLTVNPRTAPVASAPPQTDEKVASMQGPWEFARTHPNSLTLDTARAAFDRGAPGEVKPVWRIRGEARERYGLAKWRQLQPWRLRQVADPIPEGSCVRLSVEFEADDIPRSCALVVEHAHKWKLTVNGRDVPTDTGEWHWDKQFGKVDISGVVMQGRNQIELETPFRIDTEIEDVYLVGDFATTSDDGKTFRMIAEPETLDDGDWVGQGYDFYAGNMAYKRTLEMTPQPDARYVLRLKDPRGALYDVRVNGVSPGLIGWQPWEADVTDLLTPGPNEIEIEVLGTLRNTFGPLHHTGGDTLRWVGPAQFEDEADWTDTCQFAAYGLMGGAEIVCRRPQ